MRESLLKYKLYGSEGIVNSISTTLGTLILNGEKFNDNKTSNPIERICGFISKINALVSIKNNGMSLLNTMFNQISR
ncbi:hypothetical protein H7E67_16935 [Clostridium gasigenes]|uniref:hypothetical protein n=1 Tax=Clostridium gasigenes TaxID=94869 RepID=UPI0016281B11|nr:hypothetical protein [Clostridium gasigenes]MBB6625106.1 hypothetical protein [Clostridium gasigenes]MBU3132336.1 hypothetical protein [Clostridium gasigenes]